MENNIVYKITNTKNNRYYIGSTQCEIKRMKTHFLLYEDYKYLGIKRSGFANVWFNRTWINVV